MRLTLRFFKKIVPKFYQIENALCRDIIYNKLLSIQLRAITPSVSCVHECVQYSVYNVCIV